VVQFGREGKRQKKRMLRGMGAATTTTSSSSFR
jgi:hypothetical protein